MTLVSDPFDEARELFREKGGSRFHLWHDDELPRYEAFGVPPDLEESWRQELIAEHLTRLREAPDWWAVSSLAC